MKIISYKSQIKTLNQNDPNFWIKDGVALSPRAGFQINQHCPHEYRMVIDECLRNGWLKPIAYISERELVFLGLTKNNQEMSS
jgi:hypothetical protein